MTEPTQKSSRKRWDRAWDESNYGRIHVQAARARVKADTLASLGFAAQAGSRVVDVACGRAHTAIELAARCDGDAHWILCDDSTAAVRGAASGLQPLELRASVVRSSCVALPFGRASVDVVLACMVLNHLPEPADALVEIDRILSVGGRLFVVVPTPFSLVSLANLVRRKLGAWPADSNQFAARQLRALLQRHFEIEAWQTCQVGFDRPLAAILDRALHIPLSSWGRYIVARCRKTG